MDIDLGALQTVAVESEGRTDALTRASRRHFAMGLAADACSSAADAGLELCQHLGDRKAGRNL
jgi:hypothetical protein